MFFSGILIFGSLYGLWSVDFASNGPKEIEFETRVQAIDACEDALEKYNKKGGSPAKMIKTQGFSNSIWGDYKKGYIIIEKTNYEDLNENDFVVYKTSKRLINHRLRQKTKEGWIVEGDGNKKHDPVLVTEKNLVGRVLNKTFYRY